MCQWMPFAMPVPGLTCAAISIEPLARPAPVPVCSCSVVLRLGALRVVAVPVFHPHRVVVTGLGPMTRLARLARRAQAVRVDRALVAHDHPPELVDVRRLDRHQLQRRQPAHVALDAVDARVKRRGVRLRLLGVHRVAHVRAERVAVRVFPGDDSAGGEHRRTDSQDDQRHHRPEHEVAPHPHLHRLPPPRKPAPISARDCTRSARSRRCRGAARHPRRTSPTPGTRASAAALRTRPGGLRAAGARTPPHARA